MDGRASMAAKRRAAPVTILLGKGGTGRTTIARALALTSAAERPTRLLHADPTTVLPEGPIPGLEARVLDPHRIIEDAMARLVPLGPVTRTLVRHPAYQSLLEIAPGIKEAAVLNFLYGLRKRRNEPVLLDGPATGHGLHFLEAPAKLGDVLAGKVKARLENVDAMLHDPEATRVVLVALPEELPAVETGELLDVLREEGFPVAGLVVNRVPPPVPFETGEPPANIRVDDEGRGSVDGRGALALLAAQRAEAEEWLEKLGRLGLPMRIVPSLPARDDLPRAVAPFLEGFP